MTIDPDALVVAWPTKAEGYQLAYRQRLTDGWQVPLPDGRVLRPDDKDLLKMAPSRPVTLLALADEPELDDGE